MLPGAKFTSRPSLALSYIGSVTVRYSSSGRQPNCGGEQRAPPIFGRAAIILGIGPHSSFIWCPYSIIGPSRSYIQKNSWEVKTQQVPRCLLNGVKCRALQITTMKRAYPVTTPWPITSRLLAYYKPTIGLVRAYSTVCGSLLARVFACVCLCLCLVHAPTAAGTIARVVRLLSVQR